MSKPKINEEQYDEIVKLYQNGLFQKEIAEMYGVTTYLYIRYKDQVKKFLDWIYQDTDLKLERKYNTYISKYCSEENINNTLTA